MNISILIGNAEYQNLQDLPCCNDDLVEMRKLLEATEKYSKIEYVENKSARELKSIIREFLETEETIEELFFYYTGHGHLREEELYFCATNFDKKRPNETGLSNSDLHNLLKTANAKLVVKVIDACHSGIPLVKSEHFFEQQYKSEFTNLIQIASCLNSQNSLTGDPLSLFTQKFRDAALRKSKGSILYSEIMEFLKDEFLSNESQTPYFVYQGTYREKFVEDASLLEDLRNETQNIGDTSCATCTGQDELVQPNQTLLSRLQEMEKNVVTKAKITSFIDEIFDALKASISSLNFDDYFDCQVNEYSYFNLNGDEEFLTSILSKERRIDEFVTAIVRREKKQKPVSPFGIAALGLYQLDDYKIVHDLYLNISLDKIQVNFSFIPKFMYLEKIELAVICAPSLDYCYIFEIGKIHRLTDFDEYGSKGVVITREWKKSKWDSSAQKTIDMISLRLKERLDSHLDSLADKLSR